MVVRELLRHSFSLDIRNDEKLLFHLRKDHAEGQDLCQQVPEIAQQTNLGLQQLRAEVLAPIKPRKSR